MNWKKVKLGEFLINRENRFKPNDITISGLKRIEKIDFSGNIFISDKPSNTDMILVKNGDLVISGINVEKGAMAVYSGEEDITATIHYSSYRYNNERIDIDFLKYFLKSSEFKNAIKEQVPGGIKTEIKPKHLLPLIVKIPSDINGQREIVEKLKNQSTIIETLDYEVNNQLCNLKKIRQEILTDAVQGKLVSQDPNDEPAFELLKIIKAEKDKLIKEQKIKQGRIQEADLQKELIFDIPSTWEWVCLDNLCLNITDGTHQTPTYVNNGRVFLSAQNVKPFRFIPENHKFVTEEAYQEYIKNRKPEKGDILVARVGAGIGEAALIDREMDFCFYVSLGLVQPFKLHMSSEYLVYVLNSPYGVKYAKGNISSKGGSAGNFNLGRIRSFLIPVPPLNEQQRIVAKIDHLMSLITELEQNIQQNQQYTQQLMQVTLKEALGGK